jgi:hypothetical protein
VRFVRRLLRQLPPPAAEEEAALLQRGRPPVASFFLNAKKDHFEACQRERDSCEGPSTDSLTTKEGRPLLKAKDNKGEKPIAKEEDTDDWTEEHPWSGSASHRFPIDVEDDKEPETGRRKEEEEAGAFQGQMKCLQ